MAPLRKWRSTRSRSSGDEVGVVEGDPAAQDLEQRLARVRLLELAQLLDRLRRHGGGDPLRDDARELHRGPAVRARRRGPVRPGEPAPRRRRGAAPPAARGGSRGSPRPPPCRSCARWYRKAPRQRTPFRSSTGRRVSTSRRAPSQSASVCARPSTADKPMMRGRAVAIRSFVSSSSSVGPRSRSVMICSSSTTTSPTTFISCGWLTSSACSFSNTTIAIWKSRRRISVVELPAVARGDDDVDPDRPVSAPQLFELLGRQRLLRAPGRRPSCSRGPPSPRPSRR